MLGAVSLERRARAGGLGCAHGRQPPSRRLRPPPAWIAAATLPQEDRDPLRGLLLGRSNQAKAVLSVVNNRPYAQLITVTGAALDAAESSFAGSLEGALSRLLAQAGAGAGPSAFLLGPGAGATLAIDRPAPGAAHVVHIDAASDNAFAVAALTWTLLSTAAGQLRLPTATQGCVASVLYRALRQPAPPGTGAAAACTPA